MTEKKIGSIRYFVGIDIAKASFNYCLRYGGGNVVNGKVANNAESIKEFIASLKTISGFKLGYAIFGMEGTGVYGLIVMNTLAKLKAKVVVDPAIKIKNSLGIIRGKNDKLDAARITRYLIKNLPELKLWTPRRTVIDQLSSLSTLRDRMLKVKNLVIPPLTEDVGFVNDVISKTNIDLCSPSIAHIEKLIEDIDNKIKECWMNDKRCKELMDIMLSIRGIGKVTALQILIHTNEFKSIQTARTFASYCGVAPFEHHSGTSIRKRAKVSLFANKRIKALLHNGVRSCLRNDPEIKAYYKRRVEVDKKNKMSTMNAIKFKLICRLFACIKGERLYEEKYVPAAPIIS